MLEQVYDAVQKTGFGNVFASLDTFKFQCYYSYLNQKKKYAYDKY